MTRDQAIACPAASRERQISRRNPIALGPISEKAK